MTFHYRHRKKLILGICITIVLTFTSMGVYFRFFNSKNSIKKDKAIVLSSSINEKGEIEEQEGEENTYYVDIKGQVTSPGLYKIEEGKRVMDVINLAGGILETADTSVINLGKKVTDEMVIVIYSKEEVNNFVKVKEEEKQKLTECKVQNNIKNDACAEFEEESKSYLDTKISLNEGTIEQFQTLPGIGEAKAKDIIEYRETNGPFLKIEDIMNVSGIGESLFAKIKDCITI